MKVGNQFRARVGHKTDQDEPDDTLAFFAEHDRARQRADGVEYVDRAYQEDVARRESAMLRGDS